jgi:hypothetical protein
VSVFGEGERRRVWMRRRSKEGIVVVVLEVVGGDVIGWCLVWIKTREK